MTIMKTLKNDFFIFDIIFVIYEFWEVLFISLITKLVYEWKTNNDENIF